VPARSRVVYAVDHEAGLHRVAALVPGEIVLELKHLVLESWVTPDLLRQRLKSQAGPVDLQDAGDRRQIRRETGQPEFLHDGWSILSSVPRLVVVRHSPAEFIEQCGSEHVTVGNVCLLVLALIPDLTDGREVVVPASRILFGPGEAPKEKIAIGEAVVDARCPVDGWIVVARQQLPVVLRLEHRGAPRVGQWIEQLLNLLRYRIQACCRNDIAGERRVSREGILHNSGRQKSGEISVAPAG